MTSEPQTCVKCGHRDTNNKGECMQCIDWQKHVCEFPAQREHVSVAEADSDKDSK